MSTRGLVHLLGAAFLFSVMSLLVKLAGQTLPSAMMVLARAVVTLVLGYAWVRRAGLSPLGNRRPLLVLRGLFGFVGLFSFFLALTRLPLAEATVIHYVNPVLTAIFAALFLKERVRPSLVVALVLSFGGVVLVARPAALVGGASLDPVGVLAALVGAVGAAAAYVTVRKLRESDDPLVIVLYFSVVATPASLPLVAPVWVWPQGVEWLLLLGIGAVTQVAQVLLTRGLALVPAGPATAVGYVQIAFAALWGVLLFGEVPTAWTFVGALLIVGGTLAVALPRRQGAGRSASRS